MNRELELYMEAGLLVSEFMGKCGVFWSQLAANIEVLQLHLVQKDLWGRGGGGREVGMLECSTHYGMGHMEGSKEV